jgi:hypothetical protein
MRHNKALRKKLMKLEQQLIRKQNTPTKIDFENLFDKIRTSPEQTDYAQLVYCMQYIPYFAVKYEQKIDEVLKIDSSYEKEYRL